MIRVLIADDQAVVRARLAVIVGSDPDIVVKVLNQAAHTRSHENASTDKRDCVSIEDFLAMREAI